MNKITLAELRNYMIEFNRKHPEDQERAKVSGVIVYKSSNWTKSYSETQRSYRVYNCNRAFQDGKISNSIFGDCLDGTDLGVRLDVYNWEPEFCYLDENK